MLNEGLANVAKREQVEQMTIQVGNNSTALSSLEKKFEDANESNNRRFRKLEEMIESGPNNQGQPSPICGLERSKSPVAP